MTHEEENNKDKTQVINELLQALEDTQNKAKRIRENKAVVGVEAHFIEQIAKAAINAAQLALDK